MSKLQHTPRPWVISEQDIIGNEPGGYICTWSGRFANARLIAAAPEMLEALIEFNKLAHCSDDRFAGYSDIIYHDSKAIIEKATGMSIEEILK